MHGFWSDVDKTRLAILILALLAPLIGMGIGFFRDARAESRTRVGIGFRTAVGCVAGVITMPVLLFFALCGPAPGHGNTAQHQYKRAAQIVAALDQFHSNTGDFPDSLAQLVPVLL